MRQPPWCTKITPEPELTPLIPPDSAPPAPQATTASSRTPASQPRDTMILQRPPGHRDTREARWPGRPCERTRRATGRSR
jgi:hypothetical protein